MPTDLSITANEKGTAVVAAAFTDEDGATVTPATDISWTLTTNAGTEIATGTESPGATVNIVLSGDDLAMQTGETAKYVERRITVETTYNSTLGSGLPLKESGTFMVRNLLAVT